LDLFEKWEFEPVDECFLCNQKHKLYFRNARNLYKRKCDSTGQDIVSIYKPDSPYKIYRADEWYSDKWDPLEYGRDFDFSRPFFEQFQELRLSVPRQALNNVKAENSEFCNMTVGNKNCYLVFGGDFNEDTMYGTLCMHNKQLFDGDYTNDSELCYMMSDSVGCYECRYVFDSKNCTNCAYVSDCTACNNCILCTNLSQKSYCIRNQQLSKEEYEEQAKELLIGSAETQKKCVEEFMQMRENRIVKNAHTIGCERCTGDYLQHSKNCINCYDFSESEDCTNLIFATKTKDCFQCNLVGDGTEVLYETISSIAGKQSKFCSFIIDSIHIDYSEFTLSSQNCFGCNGMRHKKFCIFNKQYSQDEYESLRSRIIEHMKKTGEWGKFFPKEMSCFTYPETTANEYFPASRTQAESEGYKWVDLEDEKPDVERMIPADKLPDSIDDIPDDILNWGIECEVSGRPFKIVKQELVFYRQMNLPIPRQHPDERFKWRTAIRNPRKLWSRTCSKCNKAIQTTYSKERPERVFCEECYLAEVY
jgi:hypothetical protein